MSPNLRSKTTIRTSDTRYFVDPSIATSALGVGPNDLIKDPQYIWFTLRNDGSKRSGESMLMHLMVRCTTIEIEMVLEAMRYCILEMVTMDLSR